MIPVNISLFTADEIHDADGFFLVVEFRDSSHANHARLVKGWARSDVISTIIREEEG